MIYLNFKTFNFFSSLSIFWYEYFLFFLGSFFYRNWWFEKRILVNYENFYREIFEKKFDWFQEDKANNNDYFTASL